MRTTSRTILLLLLASLLAGAFAARAAEGEGVVNINTASVEQLVLLPRVGETVARRIIAFRQKNGDFKDLEDLLLVTGIGEATFQLIEPHITLSGETTLTDKVRVRRTKSTDEKE